MKLVQSKAMVSLVLIAVVALGVAAPNSIEATKKITIAVVRDGPSEMNEIVDLIRPELDHMIGTDYEVTFDASGEYDAAWDPQRIRPVLESALRNPAVDIVLSVGWLITQEAARTDVRLNKPFVGATPLDGDIPKLHYNEDGTLKENLCLVVQPQRTDTDLDLVYRLIRPARAHVVMTKELVDNVPEIRPALEAYGREIGIELIPVLVSTDWRSALEAIGTDVELVFFEQTMRLSRAERAAFVEALNERRIPTFSGDGPRDLEIGMLATNRQDITQKLVRRVALNLAQIIEGVSTKDLPIVLIGESKLTINGRTAAKIGFPLTFEAAVLGTILHPEALEADADSLDLRDVLGMAEAGNIELSISNQGVVTAERGKQVVRSPLFPQIGAGANYRYLDNNLVGTLFPDQYSQVGLNLSQMIFDDQLISDFRTAGREYEAARFQNESDRLDVYFNAESAYLDYVQTRLLYEIALNNLRLTEGNLEIAKVRVEVGHSGRDEVFRWTSELNQQRTLVLDLESSVETQRIMLNRILGVDLGKRWRPEPMDENADWFILMREKFGMALESQVNFDRFTDAAVYVALENSPERKFLLMNLEAEGIQLGQRKRSFIVPKLFLDLNYNYNFWQTPDVPELGDHFYEVRVTAALPLFEGTKRVYDVQLSKSVIVELERRLALADQFVEQRTRNSLRRIQASLPNIEFSRAAADNARRNFEVVRDKYANGILNITDLISAQTASFAANQDALVSLYTFLSDSVEFQRAVSFFPDTKTRSEVDAFANHVREVIDAQDVE